MTKLALGYHLILDLHGCRENIILEKSLWPFSHQETELLAIEDAIKIYGLECRKFTYEMFDNGSWSACYVLSESHLAIHTWPELGYVSADIFVCNFSSDNRNKADRLSEFLIDFFKSEKMNVQRIERA